ncbi:MAG: acyl-CoA dehydrogenase family protein [Candidatus Binatus sp.]|uniref:acyl-CoA dehydrogenase family protein n=1 Tax=Candidatus Binatus sp. TaxID=2811406 RepID=UPI00271FD113|nr:acyl-CoA dehydrogenase family protein [Candidatus Binatus sp.]MDO8431663.1 acyl-CoA dehydrogenase family protein [Candidatus Binatus sp.]
MATQHDSRASQDILASTILAATQALAPLIRESVPAMDAERRLPANLVDALRELGAFRMAIPRAYGGLELDPMMQVRVVEELSRIDGSVGWCSMISSAGSFASAFLAPAVAQRLCGDVGFSLAGQVVPVGRAELVDGGYRVSGRYRFGSGCHHASMIVGGCVVFEGGNPRLVNGRPEIRVMIFPPGSCTILDTWYTTGLVGTGSNDYVVENAFVPFEESWNFAERPRCATALYRFAPLFLVSHAGVPLGIARAAIDAVMELASRKELMPDPHKLFGSRKLGDDSRTHEALAIAEGELAAARSFAYSSIEELWQTLERGERLSSRQRALYRIMLVYVHRVAKTVTATMYDLAATSAIYRSNPLDRLMRDILTACQHGIVHPKMYRPAGRMLLGLEAGDPMF